MPGISPYLSFTSGGSNSIRGYATFDGDNFTDTFVIPHGLGRKPSYANVVAMSEASIGDYSVNWDNMNVVIKYSYPPVDDELNYCWVATV